MKDLQVSKDNLAVIKVLRKINKFSEFSDADLRSLLHVGRICEYEPGEVIIKEGALDSWVYFLIKGSLIIEKDEQKIAMLRRCGDMFGEMGVIDGSPRSATIRADSKVMILEFDAALIEEKHKSQQINFCYMIYRIFSEVLASRLRNTTDENIKVKAENVILKQQINLLQQNVSATAKKLRASDGAIGSFAKKKVLIVDGLEATRKILRSLLRELKFEEIVPTSDGESAIKLLSQYKFDLIISEWDLPRMSGFDLLKNVLSSPFKKTPFVLIISESEVEKIKQAMKADMNQCLVKPFTINTLYEKISDILLTKEA